MRPSWAVPVILYFVIIDLMMLMGALGRGLYFPEPFASTLGLIFCASSIASVPAIASLLLYNFAMFIIAYKKRERKV